VMALDLGRCQVGRPLVVLLRSHHISRRAADRLRADRFERTRAIRTRAPNPDFLVQGLPSNKAGKTSGQIDVPRLCVVGLVFLA